MNDLYTILVDLMEFYERIPGLSGDEKSRRVQKMILLILMTHVKEGELRRFYHNLIPIFIEMVIVLSKRSPLMLNVSEKSSCASCFKSCFIVETNKHI